MTTSGRLLTLLSLLQARRDWPGPLLASRLDVSPRTLRRDVERLRALGYRVRALKGPAGGYRLDAGSELPPLRFDDEQAVALAVALQTAASSGVAVGEAAERALATVRQVLPAHLRHRVDTIEVSAVRTDTTGTATVAPATLQAISEAVRTHQALRFDYRTDATAERPVAPPRLVHPHHLLTRDGRWYLVAWEPGREDWRIFRVDRMDLRRSTGPRFAPRELPGGDPASFVSARFKGSHTSDTWPCSGEVILSLPASEVAPFVADGAVEDLAPDRCRIVQGSWSWAALAAAFGRFDAEIEVVGPSQLVDAFAVLAGRFARASSDPARPASRRRTAAH